jgi:hypothetical protein
MFVSPLTQLFYEVSDEAPETAAGIENGASLLPWQTGHSVPVINIPQGLHAITTVFAFLTCLKG